jgi:hypothetical protein
MVVPAPLSAQKIVFEDSSPPAAKTASAKSDLDKVVCRTEDEIGSRLRAHKVCMTVEQWKRYQDDYKEEIQEIQSLASVRHSG